MPNPVKQAVLLAMQGIPVFPVGANKAPASPHGFRDATNDVESVKRLWSQHPAPLVGVATGEASGFDALDVDPRHGGHVWLAENRERLPPTRVHQTRGGGWHYLFQHHAGLRNSAGRIADGVDVRASGGCVIWWPAAGFPVLNATLPAPWPDWLLALALPPPRPVLAAPVVQFPAARGYAAAALRRAVDAVAGAQSGTRNHTLNREAYINWEIRRKPVESCPACPASGEVAGHAGHARHEFRPFLFGPTGKDGVAAETGENKVEVAL